MLVDNTAQQIDSMNLLMLILNTNLDIINMKVKTHIDSDSQWRAVQVLAAKHNLV